MRPEILTLDDQAEMLRTDFRDGKMVWRKWSKPGHEQLPVVLLHGGFGSWTHWIKTVPDLMRSTTVIAADMPGLGDSDDVTPPHTAEKLSDIIVQGLDEILPPSQRFHLVGFSFGGMLGSLVAATFAEQCHTFTAVGASGFGDLHYRVEGIEKPDDAMSEAEAARIHQNNLHLLMFRNQETIDDLSLHIHQSNVARGRIKSRRLSLSDGLLQALPDIKARVGGIWGEFDATGGGQNAIEKRRHLFQQHQPNARFDIIKDAGHWVMYEQADAFNQVLRAHLDLLEEGH